MAPGLGRLGAGAGGASADKGTGLSAGLGELDKFINRRAVPDKFINVRSPVTNPFQPGSDVVPAVWAGRTSQLSDWQDILRPRLAAGLWERGRTILGEPGLGKSSLVRRIAGDAERRGDWVTPQIRLALGTDPVKRLATEILRLADKAGLSAGREHRISDLLRRVQSVALSGASVVHLAPDAAEVIVDVCRGEPFLFQLAGQAAWYAGTGDVITRADAVRGWRSAAAEATPHVERILERLPPRERDFVLAMAKLDATERTLTRISTDAGFSRSTDAGPTSQRLDRVRGIIDRGTRYRFRHRAVEAFLTSDWPAVE